jgi:universal stress protein A
MITFRNILVATDFGETSDAALRYGRNLAAGYGAWLHILHVTENLVARYFDLYSSIGSDVQQQIEGDAQARVRALVPEPDSDNWRAQAVVRVSNAPAEAIVEYATEAGIDLIVMGTHGRAGVSHFLLGSVAERVVRTAPCPVLTVRRHPERDFVTSDVFAAAVLGSALPA